MMSSSDPVTRYTFWLMAFTAVLAVATLGLFLVTWSIAKSTEHLAELARIQAEDAKSAIEQATRQAIAAEKSSEMAAKALDVSLDTARKQLRAYISFTEKGKENVRDGIYATTTTFARIFYKNVGQTPALQLHRYGAIKFVKYPFDQNVDPDILEMSDEKLLQSINDPWGYTEHPGSEQSFPLDLKERITEKTLTEFQKGALAFYVMVAIVYKDIYGEVHFERQCYFHTYHFGRFSPCRTHGDSR